MKKDDLMQKYGLDEEAAQKIESAWTEAMKGFIPKDRFDAVNKVKKNLESGLTASGEQLEGKETTSEKTGELDKQIETLRAANATQKAAYESALNQLRVDSVVEKALSNAKAKNATAVKALLNLKDAKIGEDGSVEGLAEQIEKLTGAEETKFLFAAEQKPAPAAFKGFQPGASADITPDPKAAGFETRLADARKNKDTIGAIKIKQEAAAEGVILM